MAEIKTEIKKRSVDTAKYIHRKDIQKLVDQIESKTVDPKSINILIGGAECEKIRYIAHLYNKFNDLPIHLNLSVTGDMVDDVIYRLQSDTAIKIKDNKIKPNRFIIAIDSPDLLIHYLQDEFPESDITKIDKFSTPDELENSLRNVFN